MKLRQEIEGEARDELQRARESLEAEGRNSASGKLCATPFGIDVVGISQVWYPSHMAVEQHCAARAYSNLKPVQPADSRSEGFQCMCRWSSSQEP